MCAFFLAHGHQVTMLECLDLDVFIATSPASSSVQSLPSPLCFSWRAASSFLTKQWPISRLWWILLPSRMAPFLFFLDCSLTATQNSRQSPPCCSLRSSRPQQMSVFGAWVLLPHLPYLVMGGLSPAQIPMALMWLPLYAMRHHVLGGTGSAPCLIPSIKPSLPPFHVLALLPTPMGGSSTLMSPLMVGTWSNTCPLLPWGAYVRPQLALQSWGA
jgi:hypothetical protein